MRYTTSSSNTVSFTVGTKYSKLEVIKDLGSSKGHKELKCIIQGMMEKTGCVVLHQFLISTLGLGFRRSIPAPSLFYYEAMLL